jgi:hypothetical protein
VAQVGAGDLGTTGSVVCICCQPQKRVKNCHFKRNSAKMVIVTPARTLDRANNEIPFIMSQVE